MALRSVTDDIITSSNKKMSTVLVLLDFSKAFDTIDVVMLEKLKYYGLINHSIDLNKSYFETIFQKNVSEQFFF